MRFVPAPIGNDVFALDELRDVLDTLARVGERYQGVRRNVARDFRTKIGKQPLGCDPVVRSRDMQER
jgi:hypothetical protein